MLFKQTVGLDMTRGGLKTGGALVQVAVDADVSKVPALEAGLMVVEVVMSKGHVVVTAGPSDLDVGDSNLLFLSQRR